MFNGEQKEAFASASYSEKKREEVLELLALFTPYEESWGYDLLKQQITQLQPAFDEITKSFPVKKAKALLAVVKKYREWFISEHKEQAVYAGVLLLKISEEDKLRSSMIPSAMYLKLALDEVFEKPEQETVDCVYRGLMWLAFAGVPRTLAPQLTIDEVDFYNMVIRHDGKEYPIPAEGLKEFQKLCEVDSFLVIHQNPYWEKRSPRTEGHQLLRGLGEAVVAAEKIGETVSRRFMKSKWSLGYDSVQASGLFSAKYELERFGLDVSFEAEIEQRLAEMPHLDKAAISNNRSLMRSRYMEKYTQWKQLFDLQPE